MIVTNSQGVPFNKPDKPRVGATIEEKVAYMEALHAFNDAVADASKRAFAEAFAKEMRQ